VNNRKKNNPKKSAQESFSNHHKNSEMKIFAIIISCSTFPSRLKQKYSFTGFALKDYVICHFQ